MELDLFWIDSKPVYSGIAILVNISYYCGGVMKKIVIHILRLFGIYLGCLILTGVVFYTCGWYVWNQMPTRLVLFRLLFLSIILTVIVIVGIWFVKKVRDVKR